MGRALMLCFVVCLSLFVPNINESKYINADHHSWSVFSEQYYHLMEDEKYGLANRMLNNRRAEMEQYINTLSKQHQETFYELIQPIAREQRDISEMEVDKFLFYVETVGNHRPEDFIRNELHSLREHLSQADVPATEVVSHWQSLLPTLKLYIEQEGLDPVSQAIEDYTSSGTLVAKQEIAKQLDKLLDDKSSLIGFDAFLWTAAVIGATILITLIYVGARKYVAEKREKHARDKLNS
ncbi:sporulation protein YpjB [Halobacillus naozhouensis]|uniref:Sporulation protein YpjB n=1 Tax=Halobacillus naozhouensis TaxID=554880 RepID=A0ABY8IV63_9BACI|nr:sporulation protein YpjB [Halobacillus naozhouensis]WFT73088.1 sporulation protein YpjB [Halobacillus naozhouensis]